MDLPTDYDELMDLRYSLIKYGRTRESKERLAAVTARLREILAVPPAGYTMPTAATELLNHAEAHGWLAGAQWTPPSYDGEPFLKVGVRNGGWRYEATWHSRGCKPGRVRLFSVLAQTPSNPATHDGPSVKAIRAVIEANLAPAVSSADAA